MTQFKLVQGDITTLTVDAIVNATDTVLSGSGGVDLAIHTAAGSKLRKELDEIKSCNTGSAVLTQGYQLPAKFIIHTVGPIYQNNEQGPTKLEECYRSSLELCKEKNIKTVAFPAISTGAFGYPKKDAAKIAFNAVKEFVKYNPEALDEITFVVFTDDNYKIYKELLEK